MANAVRAEVALAVRQTAAHHGAEAGLDVALTYATGGTRHTDPFNATPRSSGCANSPPPSTRAASPLS
jgi:hypothetical protein